MQPCVVYFRRALLCVSLLFGGTSLFAETKFLILILSFNNNKLDPFGNNLIEENLRSVRIQSYKNWTIRYVNDCSTDGTGRKAENYARELGISDACAFTHNAQNRGGLYNIYHAVHSTPPETVIVMLDGDDKFKHGQVLEKLAKVYDDRKKDVWLTYGSYESFPGGRRGLCRKFPQKIIQNRLFRKYDWVSSHLRTFRAGLFHKISKKDLIHNGKWFRGGWDLIIMFPMLEMASGRGASGKNHIHYFDEILYQWYDSNPISDDRIHTEEQGFANKWVRSRPPYGALDTL